MMENISKSELKKSRTEEAVSRRKKQRLLVWILIILAVVVLVGGIVWYKRESPKSLPGQFIADQGREHVAPGHPHEYNSNPPTSGPHFASTAEWGIYKDELPDETLIHNLEHGGIWISYKPDINPEIKKKLENFYDKWGRKVIVAPRAKNDSDIALVAWNHLDKFSASEYSDERIDKFIKAFRNKGPEFVP